MASRVEVLPSESSLLKDQQDSVFSPNQSFQLILQTDGNLVLYKIEKRGSTPIWSSRTNGKKGSRCTMQADGNLVIYTPANKAIWDSDTNGHHGSYLKVQDDGNVVIYTRDGAPIWTTGTQGR